MKAQVRSFRYSQACVLRLRLIKLVLMLGGGLTVSTGAEPPAKSPKIASDQHSIEPSFSDPYEWRKPSADGIGKFYLGREIAKVMGHQAMSWLERSDREAEEQCQKAINMIELPPVSIIADVGAGSGFYTRLLAKRFPRGKIIALDIQAEMIDVLETSLRKEAITNVSGKLSQIDSTLLEPASIDAALMVDAYHEFSHPVEMLQSLHRALKPQGRIFLLEFRAEDSGVPIKALHKMSEQQARRELEANGFTFIKNQDGLPWQHFLVFEKSKP